MKIAVIADDLTGANDTGVQFARNGLNTSVLFELDRDSIPKIDTIVIDTDSRSLPVTEAYNVVQKAARLVKGFSFDIVYKKIDSTLRGNIGVEMDAIYDTFHPDFVLITPAYPKNARKVMDGNLYIDQSPIHETEFALDPKTPVTSSYIPGLIEQVSKYRVGLIKQEDLAGGIKGKLKEFQDAKTPYIVFDSSTEEDLKVIVDVVKETSYNVVWCGSAGLATHLFSSDFTKKTTNTFSGSASSSQPVLFVIGSVNKKNQRQLELLLENRKIRGIKYDAYLFLKNQQSQEKEINRVILEASRAIKDGYHVVLYTKGDEEDIKKANYYGQINGITPTMVSDQISKMVGDITSKLVNQFSIKKLFLTGGDTARKAFLSIDAQRFDLIDEIENGIPIGVLVCRDNRKVYAITKAGGFGSDSALVNSLKALESVSCKDVKNHII